MRRYRLAYRGLLLFLLACSNESAAMPRHGDGSCATAAFQDVLVTQHRSPEVPEEQDIYAPLLGSWDAEVVDYGSDGKPMRNRGEWHFARVLEGRAVQDVWIVPPRSVRANAEKRNNRYGSSIRVYDAEQEHWKLIWVNPVSGAENHLVGRREDGNIVHLGRQADGALYRWTFTDLTPDSFTWRGEASRDDGSTWTLQAEFFARRQDGTRHVTGSEKCRNVLWMSPDGQRLEHLVLREHANGFAADGMIVRRDAGEDFRFRYRITGDHKWRVRSVHAEHLGHDRRITLHADGAGQWRTASGEPVHELDGCIDVDIHASPFTNTIAIRRLRLAPGQAEKIIVAFLGLPDLDMVPVAQRYTRLADVAESRTYRYEGLDSGFSTDLPVDDDGLLIEYPGYFERTWKN